MWSYSYYRMERDIAKLQMKYGNIIRKEVIGVSYEGHNLYAIRVGSAQMSKRIVYTAGIHAREWMNCRLLMDKVEKLAKSIINKRIITREYIFLPMLNPDGIVVSQVDSTKRYIRSNARGVDLNRNFSCGWSKAADGSHGKKSESERETKAICRFMRSLTGVEVVIHYHSSGEEIIYAYETQARIMAVNQRLAMRFARKMGYKLGTDRKDVIPNGGFGEWCVNELNVPSITIETGKMKCPLRLWEYWWVKLFCR